MLRAFHRGIVWPCRPKGCQMTSPQSPAIKRCLAGSAQVPAPRQTFLLTWVRGCDLWSLVILQPCDLQSCMILFWKGHINICSDLKSQGPSMTQNKVSLMGKYVVLCYESLVKRADRSVYSEHSCISVCDQNFIKFAILSRGWFKKVDKLKNGLLEKTLQLMFD